jgi:hypothetical protein
MRATADLTESCARVTLGERKFQFPLSVIC